VKKYERPAIEVRQPVGALLDTQISPPTDAGIP
jgi:hypothetical protein